MAKKESDKKKGSDKANVIEQESYRDCTLDVVAEGAEQEARIDGESAHVERDADTGQYHSPEAPYIMYGSLLEAARAIVDARRERDE